jgi:soluble lytic murein transglycosylase-like protein
MTVYGSFYVVESPLNQELEPLIRVRTRDLPQDPVQRRMLLILAAVASTIILFAALGLPRHQAAAPKVLTSGEVRESAGTEGGRPDLPTQISPLFSAEVMSWQPEILRWASDHELDPDIVATIMQIESCGDPRAVSSMGAQGLFQVMPFHFGQGENMLDPDTNASRGLAYFRQQMSETNGNIYRSFAGYNGGSAASASGWDNWVDETRRYYIWSKGIYDDAKSGLDASPTLQRWLEAGGASLCLQAADRLGLQ